MGRRLSRLGAVAVIGAATLAGGPLTAGSTAATARHHTLAGAGIARAALLTPRQLGPGWRTTAPPRHVPPVTCPAFDPQLPAAVEIGAQATGRFSGSSTGPFVSQQAYAYATAAQGEAVARAVIGRRLLACVAASLTGASTRQIRFRVLRRHGLGLPGLGVAARGYRVAGTATQPEQTVAVFLDAIVLAHGRTLTELSFASFFAPPPRALELRLARAAARRIATD